MKEETGKGQPAGNQTDGKKGAVCLSRERAALKQSRRWTRNVQQVGVTDETGLL